MADKKKKTKIDLSDEAVRPLYASVGVADVALGALRDYVADVTKRLSSASDEVTTFVDDLQKNVGEIAKIDPKDLANLVVALANEKFTSMTKDAKGRQESFESAVASIGKDYKSYPALAQALLADGAEKAGKNYDEMAERGETVVNRLIGQATEAATKAADETRESFADVVDDVKSAVAKTTGKKAPAKAAAKKAPAKAAAKKAPAKAAAKKAPAKTATKAAAKPAAKKAPAKTATKAAAKPAAKPAAKKAPAKSAAAKPAAKKAPAKTAAKPAAAKPAAAKPAAAKPAAPAAAKPAAAPAKPATPAAASTPAASSTTSSTTSSSN